MNCEVLVMPKTPINKKLSLEYGELGEIKFHNWWMHKIIGSFGLFINVCLSDEAEKGKKRGMVGKFYLVSEGIHEKINFSDESIN